MKRRFALVLALIAAMVALPTVAVSQSEHSQEELDDAVDDAVLTGREMPAKFGGLWFDGMTVFVAFTAQADGGDIRKVTDLVPGWAELRVVQVDWSEAQLVDVTRRSPATWSPRMSRM